MIPNGFAKALRWTARFVAALVVVALIYLALALFGTAIPANSGAKQPAQGVRIFVIDNGVHTDLVLPKAEAGVDWRDLVRPEDLASPAQGGHPYLAFGWGDRDFYLNTPSWTAVNPLRALGALVGAGRTVLHVSHIPKPAPGPHMRQVMLSPEQYARLAGFVRATFAEREAIRGYGGNDAFYAARGGYSAINTCNQWTGGALRAGGVKMGVWTPFPFGVMRWL
jgi:uncharacterized protein (TIGR02117 family)